MNTWGAFMLGEANRGREMMVFDWDKAARLIKERNANSVSAGLSGDWEWTGGIIFKDGKPNYNSYTYLASTWATPELEIDGEYFDCYLMESETSWDEDTK
ncbi:hypothetical protein [Paenibacillus xylaniclasticus]|uniref:hypothetical protein n=1 Tax=Paenibacillus xylaniclasticus TaxID=588083 RepID=UPI000FDAB0C1|nr:MULTISPECIES: hypothetical protein [Paenibacillus]GFN32501.1 hypothetical protein PCURB6_27610 [Paenibacillus curdlanolyticus]